MDEHIRHRFVRRVIRLAYYRRALAALGLGLSVFAWVAWADAVTCRVVYNPATRTFIRICQ
jgi:hypothetical protein